MRTPPTLTNEPFGGKAFSAFAAWRLTIRAEPAKAIAPTAAKPPAVDLFQGKYRPMFRAILPRIRSSTSRLHCSGGTRSFSGSHVLNSSEGRTVPIKRTAHATSRDSFKGWDCQIPSTRRFHVGYWHQA